MKHKLCYISAEQLPVDSLLNADAASAAAVCVVNAGVLAAETAGLVSLSNSLLLSLP